MNTANNNQVGGTHYQSEFQHWDFVRHCLGNRYLEGCVTKYVARWRKKNGIQDLMKAMHYLEKIIELFDSEQYESLTAPAFNVQFTPRRFCAINGLDEDESFIVSGMSYWNHTGVLLEIRERLREMIQNAERDLRKLSALKAGAGAPYADPGIEVGGTRHGIGGPGAGGPYDPVRDTAPSRQEEAGAGYVGQGQDAEDDDGRFGRGCAEG